MYFPRRNANAVVHQSSEIGLPIPDFPRGLKWRMFFRYLSPLVFLAIKQEKIDEATSILCQDWLKNMKTQQRVKILQGQMRKLGRPKRANCLFLFSTKLVHDWLAMERLEESYNAFWRSVQIWLSIFDKLIKTS